MRKTTFVLLLLSLLSVATVTATDLPVCDYNGDEYTDMEDQIIASRITQWYLNQDLRMDLTGDGQVDIADFSYFAGHYLVEGWCYETFGHYFQEPSPMITNQYYSGGGGCDGRDFGYYLFGDRDYYEDYDTAIPGFSQFFVTVKQYEQDMLNIQMYMYEEICSIKYSSHWDIQHCLAQHKADIIGQQVELNGIMFRPKSYKYT